MNVVAPKALDSEDYRTTLKFRSSIVYELQFKKDKMEAQRYFNGLSLRH